MTALLNLLPPGLRPYAKFIYPAILSVIATAAYGLINGNFDKYQIEVGLVGLVAATVTFIVTNQPTGIGKYMKAVAPAVLTVVGVLIHYLITGEWNAAEWVAGATGFVASLIAFLVPNDPDPFLSAPASSSPGATSSRQTVR